MRVKLETPAVKALLRKKGLDKNGSVQVYLTSQVCLRMRRFMPYRTGALSGKKTYVKSSTEVETLGPYARVQYYGKVMAGAPPKKATDRDLVYTKTQNPLAGPRWDKRMMQAEGAALLHDVQEFVKGGAK